MSYQTHTLIRLLAHQMLKMSPEEAIAIAWEYFNAEPFTWRGNSFHLNRRTTVVTCLADNEFGYPEGTILHFTHTGKFYGTNDTINDDGELLGSEPVFYRGNFEIDNFNFELSFKDLEHGVILFTPRFEASADYYDMFEAPLIGEAGRI